MATGFQGAFVGGELDPALSARVDINKYSTGCRTLTNFVVQAHGGAYRRPGLSYIVTALGVTRLVEFQYNVEQTYVLAFSDDKMRVIKDDGVVLDTSASTTITAATEASPCQITATAHGLVSGDDVYISGVGGMTELNGRFFTVTLVDANNVTLNGIDSTDYTTFTSGGTISKLYTVVSPYDSADLFELYFTQSADTMYITHADYEPRTLTRADHDDWTFTTVSFGTAMSPPTGSYAIWNGSSILEAAKTITAATQADPCQITATAHGYDDGDTVLIEDIVGMTELNDLRFTVTVVDANTFTLDGIDSTGYTAYTSGGTAKEVNGLNAKFKVTALSADGEESLPSSVFEVEGKSPDDWTAGDFILITVAGIVGSPAEFNVYKEKNGLYGYIGTMPNSAPNNYRDDNFSPDMLYVTPEDYDPFSSGSDYYPSSVAFFKQRLWYAGSNTFPQSMWASQVGFFNNFNKARPLRDSDSMAFTIASTQVNAIKWLVPFQELIVGTSGAEWQVFSSSGGSYTPSTTDTKVQSYWGSAAIKPIVIGDSVVHVQAQGGKVRDLFYSLEKDGYAGNDLTVLVNHLFQGKTVKDWTFQRSPDSILWCVMSDGSLYGMTYHKEHQIFAWHKHESNDGVFESVAAIPGSLYDEVYVVINRGTINGVANTRFIEQMSDKWLLADGIEDAMFLDSALSYSGTATTDFSGLDHLEGETVKVMADGIPQSDVTVLDGEVTIDIAAEDVHIGYGYTSTLQTMSIEQAGQEVSSIGKVKSGTKIIAKFTATVGGRIGPLEDYTDPLKFTADTYGEAITPDELLDYEFVMPARYDRDGSIFVIQDKPYPMTILALMPEFVVGGM